LVQVLIVDDDATLRHLLVLQLNKLGVKADCAANGLEAVRRVNDYRYSLILMDLKMPEMDGFKAAASIRLYEKEHLMPPVPIIAISADGNPGSVKEAGMNGFFQKPLLLEQIKNIIQQWLCQA
jgi:CheY-like chemotaxis protein